MGLGIGFESRHLGFGFGPGVLGGGPWPSTGTKLPAARPS